MSSKTKYQRLERMRIRQDVFFIGDQASKIYHKKCCDLIDHITNCNCWPADASRKAKAASAGRFRRRHGITGKTNSLCEHIRFLAKSVEIVFQV